MKTVWTVVSNCCGEPRLMGVYENAGAVALAYEHYTRCCNDVGDEYRIEHANVQEYSDLVEQFEACNKRRLEAIAKDEANVTD